MTKNEWNRIKILSKERKISFPWISLYPNTLIKYEFKINEYFQKYLDLNSQIFIDTREYIQFEENNIKFKYNNIKYSIPFNYIAKIEIR
jgi:hypothetical protein